MGEEATKTIQTRLHLASGERSWLHDARLASREIFNETIHLTQQGYTRTDDECDVVQDHADRNASVNIAWREKAKLDGNESNYRTHKTQPQVRLVRLSGPGRVSRPTSSRSLAEHGVLAQS